MYKIVISHHSSLITHPDDAIAAKKDTSIAPISIRLLMSFYSLVFILVPFNHLHALPPLHQSKADTNPTILASS